MNLFLQSLLLIASFALVFVWQNTVLSQYTIQILGFFIFLFLLISAKRKKTAVFNTALSIFILNTVILLFIFSTGGFSSALFFLLYFCAFGIAFAFEPATVFVYTLGVILVFLSPATQDDTLKNFVMLGSLGLISPLAFFFGKEFKREEKQQEHIEAMEERTKDAADTIANDVEEVLKNEKKNLKSEDVEKLNEILEETEDLREETKK